MKAFLNKVLSVNAVVLIFFLMGIRNVILGSDLGAALALASVAVVMGIERYLDFKRAPDVNVELKRQLDDIKTYVTAMSIKQGMKKEPIEPPNAQVGKRWF